MQDILLRVFMVTVGLLTYPKVKEEWDGVSMHKYEERLLREEEKLDQEMTLSEEMTNFADRPQEDIRNGAEEKPDSEEKTADPKFQQGEHFIEKFDPNCPQKSKSEPEHGLRASQMHHEQMENIQVNVKRNQGEDNTDGMSIDLDGQGQDEKPESKDVSVQEVHTKTVENETSEMATATWETDYLWYIWNTFSIISMIRFFRKYSRKNSQIKQDKFRTFPVTCITGELQLPDSDTLQSFHSKCVSSRKKWREDVFLDGFANDLLEAMKTICDRNGGIVIEDFQMMDTCDITVYFNPPEQYSFQCLLWNKQASDLLPDMQVGGQIKMLANKKIQNCCPCQSSGTEDMVCLLHCENEKVKTKVSAVCEDLLCLKNTPFLSKSQVTRWFQSTIKQAWALISHKYEFELNIRYIDAPGALVIRFRSGKKVSFNMNPVVKFNRDAYFYIPPCSPTNLDTFWTLSLSKYEDHLLARLSKSLPEKSCHIQTLEIACFLHKTQTSLSGSSALKDFHFKNALMQLLLTKHPSEWKPSCLVYRLHDLLDFMERSLEKKLLHHVLIGNPLRQRIIQLPTEFTQAKTVNLFHPLVVHNCIYRNAVMHFQEMLRNAHMIIHDYL
ncbi:inositol 1,4,5-trisphosphate receptor-interacting protein [Mastacembelus armatus]|uniref:Inositol 1,4,5-trisphosphate receptor-interacting protein n=1 Tax=Mastacembelus armatus TaxID=205130 RepID=A0A3Q3RZB3_9TELE|nr:inositol 1,4,5-trisphosphate receptor-interacting protein-like [Mastacembelus armatus]XP_026160077.1 inositol 1,4,5-trisphosphate receptor-interacting protein-like [Mastacembelus armatus]